jgi:hypothetical protein
VIWISECEGVTMEGNPITEPGAYAKQQLVKGKNLKDFKGP